MTSRDLQYYKGLNYKVEVYFDEEAQRWFASIPDLGDISADASTSTEALQKILELKNQVLEADFKRGLPIPEPRREIEYSGKFLLRVPKSLHERLAKEADQEATSINRLAIQILSADLERRQTVSTAIDAVKTTVVESIRDLMGRFRAPVQNMRILQQGYATTTARTILAVERDSLIRLHGQISVLQDDFVLPRSTRIRDKEIEESGADAA